MKQSSTRITIWLSTSAIRRLDQLAKSRGSTRVSVIREALDQFLDDDRQSGANLKRLAMVSEYTQAAIDVLMREQHPARVEDLVQVVASRMEKFHGGR